MDLWSYTDLQYDLLLSLMLTWAMLAIAHGQNAQNKSR